MRKTLDDEIVIFQFRKRLFNAIWMREKDL